MTNENDYVKLGAYHTLDLEGKQQALGAGDLSQLMEKVVIILANRDFSIHKHEGGWDSVALEVIEDATREGRGADVGAVVLGEGTAVVCLLSEHMTVIKQRIDMSIPRKRAGGVSGHDKVCFICG